MHTALELRPSHLRRLIQPVYWLAFDPHDKEAHVPYEVVDPSDRAERGTIHRTLTAAMVNAGPSLEVWQLADDAAQTRTVMCWPDAEFQPAAGPSPEQTAEFVRDHIGRAEREASAIMAEHNPVSPQQVHALVSLAWGRGFVAGYGAGSTMFADLLERTFKDKRS